jgi:ABC-2 type transport system permease protein
MIMSLSPFVQSIDWVAMAESLPEGMGGERIVADLSPTEHSFYQYLSTEWASWIQLVAAYFGIWVGASVVARDFGNGTLDALLSAPIGRTIFIVTRMFALMLGASLLCSASLVGTVIGVLLWVPDVDVRLTDLALMHLQLLLFTLATSGIGLFLATLLLQPGRTYGVGALLMVVMFLLVIVATFASGGEWIANFTLFSYWHPMDQLVHGKFMWKDIIVLSSVTLTTSTAAILIFRRRDIVA